MADNDDRPWDASRRAGRPDADDPWADLVVPDDIRGLWRDVAAYRREVRRAERARRARRLLARRGAVPALVLTVAVLLAGVVAALLATMAPRTVIHAPAAAPLASPATAPGTLGGLLPQTVLQGPDGPVGTRSPSLRPAVFALVPTGCTCRSLLNSLSGQAYGEGLQLAIVVPAASDRATATLARTLRGDAGVYFDATATLATSVTAQGVTVVVVDRDGTIYDIKRGVTDPKTTSLDAALQSMLLPERS